MKDILVLIGYRRMLNLHMLPVAMIFYGYWVITFEKFVIDFILSVLMLPSLILNALFVFMPLEKKSMVAHKINVCIFWMILASIFLIYIVFLYYMMSSYFKVYNEGEIKNGVTNPFLDLKIITSIMGYIILIVSHFGQMVTLILWLRNIK